MRLDFICPSKPIGSRVAPMFPSLALHVSHPSALFLPIPLPLPKHRRHNHFPVPRSLSPNGGSAFWTPSPQQPPRTLFPGGYKRPEVRVPGLLLLLHPDDVADSLDLLDRAVSCSVDIVVLHGGADVSGKRLYEAACLVKSVVRDRAYFLIGERVDIASAVNASGVVLSDQGLPSIVARNMMMESKPHSVVLPLVGRNVGTPNAALTASNYEGADFIIYSPPEGEASVIEGAVRIPVFVANARRGGNAALLREEAAIMLGSGGSGLVVSLDELRVLGDGEVGKLFCDVNLTGKSSQQLIGGGNVVNEKKDVLVSGFNRVREKEKELLERERLVLLEAIDVIRKAAPLMEEVSLLVDAVAQLDEPFLLAIVGEFNSGKSSFINALLGERYLKEGVVPTTNEITFLQYSEYNYGEQQRCEKHPDGQYICYLPAPILREMNIVDTPGTNVILQRQQRLTEEFVPRADLLLFVISADRPLTESEVAFLRYTQQWKKKVVFVLNKSDLYQNATELVEAISFIRENTRKLLNTEDVTLYPVSSRLALEFKLSALSDGKDINIDLSVGESNSKISSFYELERYLYSFLEGSSSAGLERMKLKLETPIRIAERLLSACENLVKQDCRYAKQDLTSIIDTMDSVRVYARRIEDESIFWRRKALSMVDSTKFRVVDMVQSTLQLSNLDLVASYAFRGGSSAVIPASLRVQNDIVGPALTEADKHLDEYTGWLQSSNARQGKSLTQFFENRWPSSMSRNAVHHIELYDSLRKQDSTCLRILDNLSSSTASKLFDQEIREVFLATFGGLGAAGLSASLLTSVLPTTLEDLLALGLCSAGGYIAILNFPARRKIMIDKINRIADDMAQQIEESMLKDLEEMVGKMEKFVKIISKPYEDAAQERLDKLVLVQGEILNVEKKIRTLQVEIQNIHMS